MSVRTVLSNCLSQEHNINKLIKAINIMLNSDYTVSFATKLGVVNCHFECHFVEIDMCVPNPCVNGDCSSSSPGEFECKCDFGFTGALCDEGDQNTQ